MNFSSLLSILSIAAASAVRVDTFSVMTIHSGSDVQYQEVKLSSDGHFSLNGETELKLNIDSEGLLYANGDNVSLIQGAPVVTPGTWDGAKWEIVDGHLQYQEANAFVICPEANSNLMFAKYGAPSSCANPIGVSLKVLQ